MAKYHNFTVNFICDVCGLPTADSVVLSTKFWDENTGLNLQTGLHWREGYIDHRHSTCEQTHGSFKEMVDEYREKIKDDFGEAEQFVVKNRKKGDFNRELRKEIIKKEEKVIQ
jgi:hypothetical protein